MTQTITKKQAEDYLAAVERKFQSWNIDNEWDKAHDGDKPTLRWNWNDDGHPAIIWEGNSPDDWALYPIEDEYIDPEWGMRVKGVPVPDGVHAEPYYSFVLMLYPEY